MQDDGPQVILPAPEAPERVAQRLREAREILAEAGFAEVRVEDHGQTLVIRIPPADLPRLHDEGSRDRLVARLKSLGYAFAAVDLAPDDADGNGPGGPA